MFDATTLLGIGGWFTIEEAKYLYDEAIKAEGLIVELGSWMGRSTYALACAVRDSKKPPIIAVDRFTGSSEHRADAPDGRVWTFPQYYDNLTRVGAIPDHVITIIGDTVQVARIFPNESVGLLFHDASHEYEFIVADLRAWVPKVRKDGVICVHDIAWWDVERAGKEAGFEVKRRDEVKPALNSFKRV
jgi:hypothetical protein